MEVPRRKVQEAGKAHRVICELGSEPTPVWPLSSEVGSVGDSV